MRIVIIGTGNAATVLGKLFINKGHTVSQVIGRNKEYSEKLGYSLSASFTTATDQITMEADLYMIAVADSAIGEMASRLRVDKKIIVHTAGSVSKNILKDCSKNYGVLYPLQSLRKEMTGHPEIPFLVDGNTDEASTLIYDFASSLSDIVHIAGDPSRLMTHIAAVMVSNFANHLYALAEDFCLQEKVDFKILLPLIREVANRLQQHSPKHMQTGPAIRNDDVTIEKHLSSLQLYPLQQALYRYLTTSIRQWHNHEL